MIRTMERKRMAGAVALALGLLTAACDKGAPPPAETAPAAAAPSGVVDSVFPMEVMLARFREGVPEPKGLTSGAGSRDALVRGVIDALETSDTLRFEKLAVSLPEYAWLYFPTTKEARPPYELPPALAWFRVQEANRQGVFRALRELGGKKLDFQGYVCDPEPTLEGDNKIWTGCLVKIPRPGKPSEFQLFGAIVERDGRFAIISYANDF